MKAIFMTILRMLDENENVTEVQLHENGEYSKIKYKTEDGTYALAIIKEKTDGDC